MPRVASLRALHDTIAALVLTVPVTVLPAQAQLGGGCIDHVIIVNSMPDLPIADCGSTNPSYDYPQWAISCADGTHHSCSETALIWQMVNGSSWPLPQCSAWNGVLNLCDTKPEDENCEPSNAACNHVADPVDLTTGALKQTVTDVDGGGGLVFKRHYASNAKLPVAPAVQAMGLRWKHSFEWSLQVIHPSVGPSGTVIALVHRPLVHPLAFSLLPSTTTWITSGARGKGKLEGLATGPFIFTDSDGTQVGFDGTGQLASIRPPGQAMLTVEYPGGGVQRFKVGNTVKLEVTTASGVVTSVNAPGIGTWTYTYTDQNLTRVVGPDPSNPGTQLQWDYAYVPAPGLEGRLTGILRNGSSYASWTYNDNTTQVSRADEPNLDQPLRFDFSNAAQPVVKDDGGTVLETLTIDTTNQVIAQVSGPGGPGAPVPFDNATFVTVDGNSTGRWHTVTDRKNATTLYEYDDQGRVNRISEGWNETDNTASRVREITNHPALDHPLVVTEKSTITGALDRVTTYDYDDPNAAGNTDQANEAATPLLHRIILAGETFDSNGQPISFTDTTTLTYNAAGQVIKIAGPRIPEQYTEIDYDSATGSRSAVRRFLNGPGSSYLQWSYGDFDANGNPRKVADPNHSLGPNPDPDNELTLLTYDALNRIKTVRPPYEGTDQTSTITFTYDVDGNLTRVDFPLDTAGHAVFLRMGYDAKRNLQYLAVSAPTPQNFLNQDAIVYEYNGQNRATREARYTGFTDYSPESNRGTKVGDAQFDYDSVGRLWHALNPLFASSVQTTFAYDGKGNPTSITDENGHQDSLLPDLLDRLKQITQHRTVDGNSIDYVTQFDYDTLSNVIKVTDAASKVTDMLHDDRGNLVRTISPDTGTTLFLYDAAGNLTQKIENFAGTKRTTSYSYDGLNRLTGITYPSDPAWVFTYDTDPTKNQKGRLASVTNGVVTTHLEYTLRGDIAAERMAIDGRTYSVTDGYDATGNSTSITGPDGTQVATAYAGLRAASLAVVNGSTTYPVKNLRWYPFGPRTHAEFPSFTGAGGASTVVSDRDVDLRGQVDHLSVSIPGGNAVDRTYTYNYTGGPPGPSDLGPNLDELLDAVDSTESRFYFYDELNRLQKTTDLSGSVLFQYGYDAVGNRTSQVSTAGITNYSYEVGTDRLDGSTGVTAYDYAHDAFGNRIYRGSTAYVGTPSHIYNQANRLVQVKDPANGFAVVANYTYDAFGRRVKKVIPNPDPNQTQTFLYFYDTAGHLVQEIQRTVGGAIKDHARTYAYVEDELMGVVDADYTQLGSRSWLLLRLPDAKDPLWVLGMVTLGGLGLVLVARRRVEGVAAAAATSTLLLVFMCAGTGRQPAVFSWVHTDPLGTPLAVTNTNDYAPVVVIWRAKYEPFGRATVNEDPDGNQLGFVLNVRFPGQYFDAETSLHYNYSRSYDPNSGRYLESDPLGLSSGVNLYAYASNSPLMVGDKLGLDQNAGPCPKTSKKCKGKARILKGNSSLVGNPGAFPGVEVQNGTAASIPEQFGLTTSGLAPFIGGISGQTADGSVSFSGVTDVIGGKSPIKGMNVRDALQVLYPNTFIVELPSIASDAGVQDIVLSLPLGLPCPKGTVEVEK
jgi:RHS repeat-associated protein